MMIKLKQPVIIPAGTVLTEAPSKVLQGDHYDEVLAFGPDNTGTFTIHRDVAKENPDIFEVIDD